MFVIDDICLVCLYTLFYCFFFFFSSRRRHTRCALVTGVQTCALPILRHDRIVAVGRFAAVTKTWQIECDQAAGAAQKRRDLRPVVLVGADTMHHHQWLAAAAVEIGDLETRNLQGLALDAAEPVLAAQRGVDRTSVVWGQSVSVRVGPGGRRS